MLDPAGAGQNLLMLELVASHLGTVVIENHAASAGSALIDGGYELGGLGQFRSWVVGCDTSSSMMVYPSTRSAADGDDTGQTVTLALPPVNLFHRLCGRRGQTHHV